MNTMLRGLSAAICCMMICMGCSVKEDRRECPCRLFLDFSENDAEVVEHAELHVISDSGFMFRDIVESDDFCRADVMVPVPRYGVSVNAYYGADGYVGDDCCLRIPYGCECPRVYMHSSYVDTDSEVAYETVRVFKNHCVITVHVEEGDFPYSLDVRGNVCGYGICGSPAEGEFLFSMKPDGDGTCSVTVPRQTTSSLVLDVDDGTNVLKTFALGEYVMASGYDWGAESLDDITVGLDYSLSSVTLKIDGWEKELHFDVEI